MGFWSRKKNKLIFFSRKVYNKLSKKINMEPITEYFLSPNEMQRYARHGIVSIPFDIHNHPDAIAINLKHLKETLDSKYATPKYVWFTHRELKIATSKNSPGHNATFLDKTKSLDTIVVAANKYLPRSYPAYMDIIDPPPLCRFDYLKENGAILFPSDWQGWQVDIAVLPVYELISLTKEQSPKQI
ncbi:hypothetical protein A2642_04110 [Candidatus Nomurabacteria bacterium RIFCSPHIGHO2_01_FULL_39_10]|uniref:Uncharacterized protein n=1 Tax=Candidatus Nomurabacteria bacterium RIFCSPHIGHO2_01_FULL_39_10 TaxID=1801733 RepID=A0A1F6V7S1_9BACT|nr:MAG: hypothetical protein A2642_04110 [Candidatus Nomurabacteria bacterium RIFCSPHIGHO2_01_FULL_39_10]